MAEIPAKSRRNPLRKLDGRRREVRFLRDIKAELLAHLGANASATQIALVDRVAWLTLHISQLDASAASGVALTPEASRAYLSLSGSLARTLRQLGVQAVAPKVLTLAEHVAARSAGKASAA